MTGWHTGDRVTLYGGTERAEELGGAARLPTRGVKRPNSVSTGSHNGAWSHVWALLTYTPTLGSVRQFVVYAHEQTRNTESNDRHTRLVN